MLHSLDQVEAFAMNPMLTGQPPRVRSPQHGVRPESVGGGMYMTRLGESMWRFVTPRQVPESMSRIRGSTVNAGRTLEIAYAGESGGGCRDRQPRKCRMMVFLEHLGLHLRMLDQHATGSASSIRGSTSACNVAYPGPEAHFLDSCIYYPSLKLRRMYGVRPTDNATYLD